MTMTVVKEFLFEAAHRLPHVPEGHKCARMHGHSYKVQIKVTGQLVQPQGWVVDFGDISSAWDKLDEKLDHNTLNEIEGLENPTAENLAVWIFVRLKAKIDIITSVTVWETATAGVICEGAQ